VINAEREAKAANAAKYRESDNHQSRVADLKVLGQEAGHAIRMNWALLAYVRGRPPDRLPQYQSRQHRLLPCVPEEPGRHESDSNDSHHRSGTDRAGRRAGSERVGRVKGGGYGEAC
jgi:hypothetical protein